MTDEDKRWLAVLVSVLATFVAILVLMGVFNATHRTQYYDCVKTMKSTGVTPTDLRMICDLRR